MIGENPLVLLTTLTLLGSPPIQGYGFIFYVRPSLVGNPEVAGNNWA